MALIFTALDVDIQCDNFWILKRLKCLILSQRDIQEEFLKKIVGLHTTWKPMVDPVIQSKKVLIFENIANITMLIQIPRVGK